MIAEQPACAVIYCVTCAVSNERFCIVQLFVCDVFLNLTQLQIQLTSQRVTQLVNKWYSGFSVFHRKHSDPNPK